MLKDTLISSNWVKLSRIADSNTVTYSQKRPKQNERNGSFSVFSTLEWDTWKIQEYIPSASCLSYQGVPLGVLEKIRLVLSLSLYRYIYVSMYTYKYIVFIVVIFLCAISNTHPTWVCNSQFFLVKHVCTYYQTVSTLGIVLKGNR
jgi:hypothetical protein